MYTGVTTKWPLKEGPNQAPPWAYLLTVVPQAWEQNSVFWRESLPSASVQCFISKTLSSLHPFLSRYDWSVFWTAQVVALERRREGERIITIIIPSGAGWEGQEGRGKRQKKLGSGMSLAPTCPAMHSLVLLNTSNTADQQQELSVWLCDARWFTSLWLFFSQENECEQNSSVITVYCK